MIALLVVAGFFAVVILVAGLVGYFAGWSEVGSDKLEPPEPWPDPPATPKPDIVPTPQFNPNPPCGHVAGEVHPVFGNVRRCPVCGVWFSL